MRWLALLFVVSTAFSLARAQHPTVSVDVSTGRLHYTLTTSQLTSTDCAADIQVVDGFANLVRALLLFMPLEWGALEPNQQIHIRTLELSLQKNNRTLVQLRAPATLLDSLPNTLQRELYTSQQSRLSCDTPAAHWLDKRTQDAINIIFANISIAADDESTRLLKTLLPNSQQLRWYALSDDGIASSNTAVNTSLPTSRLAAPTAVLPSQLRNRPPQTTIPAEYHRLPPATLPPATLPSATLPPATLPPATLPPATLPSSTLPAAVLDPAFSLRLPSTNAPNAPNVVEAQAPEAGNQVEDATSTPLPPTSAQEAIPESVQETTQAVSSAAVNPASYGAPVTAQPTVLLPSVQQRIAEQNANPLVLPAIPDVSSPSVAYPLYKPQPAAPIIPSAPTAPITPDAFRFGLGPATASPSTVAPDILATAGETKEGYLHVVGYERLPAISPLRVTNFAAAQAMIDKQRHYLAVIETNKGRIIAELYSQLAPVTVNNFVFLSRYRFYDGVTFHRVVANFLAQTGDPTGTGEGTPGYTFADEIHSQLRHNAAGVLSMANNGPDTNGSQFFMSLQAMPWLDGKHSIFGQVIAGYEVLGRLQPTEPTERIPSFYLDVSATLDTVTARDLHLANEAAFREQFRQAMTLVEATTFTTEPLPSEPQTDPSPTLADYLRFQQGDIPSEGTFFSLAGREVALVINAEGEKQLAVFAPDDFIERVYILQEIR